MGGCFDLLALVAFLPFAKSSFLPPKNGGGGGQPPRSATDTVGKATSVTKSLDDIESEIFRMVYEDLPTLGLAVFVIFRSFISTVVQF